jgi:adenylate cyclase
MPEQDRFGQDNKLAQALEKYSVVLPQVASTTGKNKTFGSAVQVVGVDPQGSLVEYPGIIANVPKLEERAAGTGVVNTFPEIDGVVRRMPLLILSGETVHPAIGLETLRLAAGDTRIQVKITDIGVEAVRIPKLNRINVDPLSRVWIDWSQQPKQHSLAKLPKDFNGEVVIVGLSAAGLVQPVATARGEIWPQDMQASLLGTLLSGTAIQRPSYADDLEVVAMLMMGLLLVGFAVWKAK